jgi:hypothetical protein
VQCGDGLSQQDVAIPRIVARRRPDLGVGLDGVVDLLVCRGLKGDEVGAPALGVADYVEQEGLGTCTSGDVKARVSDGTTPTQSVRCAETNRGRCRG